MMAAAAAGSNYAPSAGLGGGRALSYAASSVPRGVPPIIGGGPMPSPSEFDAHDDSVTDRLHGGDDDAGSDAGGEREPGRRTPRGGNGASGYPSKYGGGRGPLTPRTTVYVTNAVTARFISERYETSVRDALQQQEYEHRLDLLLYFQQQTAAIAAREHKAQLREALEQQYLARAEVEELRGAVALRIGDIEEQARMRLEQLAGETRASQEREISRLYGIVSAGQNAAQQQWLLGCEERERHFIASEGDRLWSRLQGSYLSEQHSLQLKGMLKERIPVVTSRVVNDALDSVHEAPQVVRPIMQLPAQTASPQILVKGRPQTAPAAATSGAEEEGSGGGNELTIQPLQIRRQQRAAPAPRGSTPPASARSGGGGTDDEDVKPITIAPRPKPKTPVQVRRTVAGKISAINEAEEQARADQDAQRRSTPNRTAAVGGMSQRAVTPKSHAAAAAAPADVSKARAAAGGIEVVELDASGEDVQPSSNQQRASAGTRRRPQPQIQQRSLLDTEAPRPSMPKPSGLSASEASVQESLADRRKRARQQASEHSQQQRAAAAARRESPSRERTASNAGGGGGAALVERPLPAVFHPFWGFMFRSNGALLTWQRRLFVFTSNGRLRCAHNEKGPWMLVTTADKILRVEVDSYHDVGGNGLAPPTTQYHQYGFFVDVIDTDTAPAPGEPHRQKRLRFCCFSRGELTNWMHILRRATETVGQLAELGVAGAISPVRRRFEDLAEEAVRLGGAHVAEAMARLEAQHRADNADATGANQGDTQGGNDLLNKWLAQHQDADGNPIPAPAIVPYRARVQLEDEVAVLERREQTRAAAARRAESEQRDPALAHPIAHYNTPTSLGKPRPPHDVEQYA